MSSSTNNSGKHAGDDISQIQTLLPQQQQDASISSTQELSLTNSSHQSQSQLSLQPLQLSTPKQQQKQPKEEKQLQYEPFSNENDSNNSINHENNDDNKQNTTNNNDSIESMSYLTEIISLFGMSLPLSIGNFARLAMYNIDSIFLGHLGTDELAGVALCMILMEIVTNFVYSPAWSLNGLCSQAIGAGNPQLAGNWLQLAIGLCTIISMPALVVYWYIADIIGIFEDNSDVIHYARIFSHFAGCWLLLGAVTMAIRGYLQSIEVITPLTIVPIITIAFDALMNYVLIYGINIKWDVLGVDIQWNGLGFIGSPLAQLMAVIVQVLLFYFWCFRYKKYHIEKNAWSKWSWKSFEVTRIKRFSKIMIPNMISDATENWAYQVTVIMCATLPSSNVAALSCMFDFWGVLWSFYSGFGACTIAKVGKEIGCGNIKKAQFLSKVCVITGAIVTFILGTLCFLFSNEIGQLYSNDNEVIEIMDTSLKILSFVYFFGSIGWTASNLMESMSKNKERGIVLVVTAWIVYLPLAMYFAFAIGEHGYENVFIFGLFGIDYYCPVCMIFGVCLFVEVLRTVVLWLILIYKNDWKYQSLLAMIRSEIKVEVIERKLGYSKGFIREQMMKYDKNSEGSKNSEDRSEESAESTEMSANKRDKDDDNGIEYVSLHNAESFSTSVEIMEVRNEEKYEEKSIKLLEFNGDKHNDSDLKLSKLLENIENKNECYVQSQAA